MNEVIEHVKKQLLSTTVAPSANGANALGSVVMAYVHLMQLAVDIEMRQMQFQMEAAERGFGTQSQENTAERPSSLVVAR